MWWRVTIVIKTRSSDSCKQRKDVKTWMWLIKTLESTGLWKCWSLRGYLRSVVKISEDWIFWFYVCYGSIKEWIKWIHGTWFNSIVRHFNSGSNISTSKLRFGFWLFYNLWTHVLAGNTSLIGLLYSYLGRDGFWNWLVGFHGLAILNGHLFLKMGKLLLFFDYTHTHTCIIHTILTHTYAHVCSFNLYLNFTNFNAFFSFTGTSIAPFYIMMWLWSQNPTS